MELALFYESRCAEIINPHEMERTKVLTTNFYSIKVYHSPLLACGEGVGGGVLVSNSTEKRYKGNY